MRAFFKVAIIFLQIEAPTGASYTFNDSLSLANRFSSAMHETLGAKKSDVLAILMPNNPEYIMIYSGAANLGVTLTTVNPVYTSSEIARQLKMSRSNYIATLSMFLPKVKEALTKVEGN